MSNLLATYGIHTGDECDRLLSLDTPEAVSAELGANFESLAVEVLLDEPVSPLYHYSLDTDGAMYSCKPSGERYSNIPIKSNPWERNGYVALGRERLAHALLANPGAVVVHYSPAGPVYFDDEPCVVDVNDPRFSQREDDFVDVKPYQDGQLYIQYYDGRKVSGVAVKVGNEVVVERLIETLGLNRPPSEDEIDRIKYYLTHPVTTTMAPEEFGAMVSVQQSEGPLYQGNNGMSHSVADVGRSLTDTFKGVALRPGMKFAQEALDYIQQHGPVETWTPDTIKEAYLTMALSYADHYGLDTVSFEGGCGGMEHSVLELMGEMGYSGHEGSLHWFGDMYDMVYRGAMTLSSADIEKRLKPHSGYKGPWGPGVCRPRGLGGCGERKQKVGLCNICVDCQKIYDAGKKP